jgi:putative hydrolase of the HAD superfamily
MSPRAVLFDYGNVLCLPQSRKEVEAMAALLDSSLPRFEEAYWKDRLGFDQAALTPEAYWSGVAEALSRHLSEDRRRLLTEVDNRSWSCPNPTMVSWASALRVAGIRTAVLSNMPITVRSHLLSVSWLPQVDYSCYSCDLRCAKPAPAIFQDCLKGVGVEPAAALFLDDREENIDAARKLGIHAIHFVNPEQAQKEIDKHYRFPVRIGLN